MSRHLTSEERVWIVTELSRKGNQRQVVRNWPFQTPPPSRGAVQNLAKKFKNHATLLNMKKSGRPRSVLTEINSDIVSQMCSQDPTSSVRRTAAEIGMRPTSVWNILKSIKMKAFLPTLVQGLLEQDPVQRLYDFQYQQR
jgi:hypothetical protein